MWKPAPRFALVMLFALGAGAADVRPAAPIVVHEWGTFTTVAGETGEAVEWLPLGGAQDLPCFVYPFDNRSDFKFFGNNEPILSYDAARFAMRGRVRMETPVIYFYTPEATSASVRVGFPQGLMTEVYPKATINQVPATAHVLRGPTNSALRWDAIAIEPKLNATLPVERAASHYYAARATDAATIRVGNEVEKFLFYRGVAGFDPPIAATATGDGVKLENLSSDPVSGVILFENRAGRVGFRVVGTLRDQTTVAAPALDSSVEKLHSTLTRLLTNSGLYAREAAAMIETWRDSWFEEGTRVFYLVPSAFVDQILPLSVTPTPSATVRTFVGRMEVFTPAQLRTVADAIAEGDDATMATYGRFLDPMTERILTNATDEDRARIRARVNERYRAHLDRVTTRCR